MDSGTSLRIEKTALKAVVKKTYVLDTNVLLHDPTAITAFNEHHVVIPMTVLEELDHIKDRHEKTVSREARIAINMIDKVVDGASPQTIQAGVEVPGSTVEGPLGNLAQIDNKYISPLTSGLTCLVEKAKAYPHAGIMHVNGIVRSRLAAFAEEQL